MRRNLPWLAFLPLIPFLVLPFLFTGCVEKESVLPKDREISYIHQGQYLTTRGVVLISEWERPEPGTDGLDSVQEAVLRTPKGNWMLLHRNDDYYSLVPLTREEVVEQISRNQKPEVAREQLQRYTSLKLPELE